MTDITLNRIGALEHIFPTQMTTCSSQGLLGLQEMPRR